MIKILIFESEAEIQKAPLAEIQSARFVIYRIIDTSSQIPKYKIVKDFLGRSDIILHYLGVLTRFRRIIKSIK